jgi:hypothetical protein
MVLLGALTHNPPAPEDAATALLFAFARLWRGASEQDR